MKTSNLVPPNDPRSVMLIGHPNVGKTTLFNELTHGHQKVANYTGVTQEITSGVCFDNFGQPLTIYDSPGLHSLSAYHTLEEQSIFQWLLQANLQTRILCVLDARHLERQLLLGTQLLALGLPICFAITFSENARKHGYCIDAKRLEETLQVPVVLLASHSARRQRQLRDLVTRDPFKINRTLRPPLPENLQNIFQSFAQTCPLSEGWFQSLLLQDKEQRDSLLASDAINWFDHASAILDQSIPHWKTQLMTVRYQWIQALLAPCVQQTTIKVSHWNMDRLFLHPWWGPIIACGLFFTVLFAVFTVSEWPMRWCEQGIIVLQKWIQTHLPNTWLSALLREGIIGGVGNVLLFLPQFVLMIACIGVLENTGYIARVMFLIDRWMKKIGLSGPSFVALVSCYACTIPGIMQARSIANKEERLTTLFVAPWVNCASRIPIYLLLISLLFSHISPVGKTLLVMIIYGTGLVLALLLAALIRKFFLKTRDHAHIAEMPLLLRPQWHYIFKLMHVQALFFLKKAGTWVLAFSIGLWICLHTQVQTETESIDCVHWLGRKLEVVLKPIGFDENLSISLLSAFGMRENFISTLGVLHNVDAKSPGCLREQLHRMTRPDGQPVYSFATCISLILFFMFSLQCIGTLAFMRHETHSWRLALFQFSFMNAFAYALCFTVYHLLI